MLGYLQANGWSLVVRNHGEQTHYTQHGVRDLYELQNSPVLQGAAVADKIIGKGAAALMIAGGVKYVTTEAISQEAIDMLRNFSCLRGATGAPIATPSARGYDAQFPGAFLVVPCAYRYRQV